MMLYEFHRLQNSKKPGTIHATYLVSGTKREGPQPTNKEEKDGEDEYMQSSPFVGSSMPQPDESTGESGVLTISLVKEEDLDGTSLISLPGGQLIFLYSSEIPIRDDIFHPHL
jgi:DNA polymerase delta subunit 3